MTKGQNHCNWHPSQFTPSNTFNIFDSADVYQVFSWDPVNYLFANCSKMYFVTWFWHVYIFNPQFIHMQCIENMWINGNFKSCFGSPCNTNIRASVCWSVNARCPMLTQALDHPHNIAACLSVELSADQPLLDADTGWKLGLPKPRLGVSTALTFKPAFENNQH